MPTLINNQLESLRNKPRLLLKAGLQPLQGDRFQPTGFADLGAAIYKVPAKDDKGEDVTKLLVESAQSMANRLEKVCLDGDGPHLLPELKGLSYVVARLTGQTDAETSSLVEAHRLNSPFIISDKDFAARFEAMTGYAKGQVIDWKKVAAALFHFDVNSLVHGVFMANLGDGRLRIARALTGFIEASDVREVVSGGVKNNPLDPTGKIRAEGYDKDVYSNVPYHRTEYTARQIDAFFNLDLGQIRSYRLPEEAEELLVVLSLFKVRKFLSGGLRLRTACDFVMVHEPQELPDEQSLLSRLQELVARCGERGYFANPPVTTLETKVVLKKEKDS